MILKIQTERDRISWLNFLFHDWIAVAQFPVDTRIRLLAYSRNV